MSLRAFDWPSSIPGSKVTAKKPHVPNMDMHYLPAIFS